MLPRNPVSVISVGLNLHWKTHHFLFIEYVSGAIEYCLYHFGCSYLAHVLWTGFENSSALLYFVVLLSFKIKWRSLVGGWIHGSEIYLLSKKKKRTIDFFCKPFAKLSCRPVFLKIWSLEFSGERFCKKFKLHFILTTVKPRAISLWMLICGYS